MTTIHLDDAQLAQFTATGLIVVDGYVAGHTTHYYVAPELWRKLTDPCPTCRGKGHGGYQKCQHCVGGCQVVTLTATCPIGWSDQDDCSDARCTEGVVTLGRFIIRLLPVQFQDFERNGEPFVLVYDGVFRVDDPDPVAVDCPLDPEPQPGQWAIDFEAAPT